jgi:hypothetical protein
MDALARRDLKLARSLPEMDDPLDRLNRGMLQQCLRCGTTSGCWSGGSGCTWCRAKSSGSVTARWTSPSSGIPGHGGVPRVHRRFASGDRTPELLERGGSPDQRTTKPNTGDFFVEFAFVSRWAGPASPPGTELGTPRSHQLRRQGLDAPAMQEYSASEAAGASGLWLSLVCRGLLGRSG